MKTNIVLKSKDRNLFGVLIRQETKTEMLCVTDLDKVASERNEMNGYKVKHIPEILSRRENIDRIYFIAKKQNFINVDISTFTENVKNQGVVKHLKQLKLWKTTGRGQNKVMYSNPYIWMLIALEISPELYGEALVWLTDNLIVNRIEAGDMYLGLTSAVSKFSDVDYRRLAKGMNYVVFNRHETNIRNNASQKELKELHLLEYMIAELINNNFLETFKEVLDFLRKKYAEKYFPKPLLNKAS